MRTIYLFILVVLAISACRQENVYERFYSNDIGSIPASNDGLILKILFDGDVAEQSSYGTSVSLNGNAVYVQGVNGMDSSALYLSGFPQCLTLSNIGNHDTLSVFMWFKTDEALGENNAFSLFDYGVGGFSVKIDGMTGETLLNTKFNDFAESVPQWVNSYNTWNYLYAEAGAGKISVLYKGEMLNQIPIEVDYDIEIGGAVQALTDILYIGRQAGENNDGAGYFKGSIDNLRVYKRSLSKAEVMALVNEDISK
jgi:hypothetical protein